MKITRIQSIHLSDGGLLEISKQGRSFAVMRGFSDWFTTPEITRNLTKVNAEKVFLNYLKNDVTEN